MTPVRVGQVHVPGPRGLDKYNPRFQPHILTITEQGEFEVEHPEDCPIKCYWWPGAREYISESHPLTAELAGAGEHDCYVGWELANVGLDTLDLGLEDDEDESLIVDPEHVPASQWEPFWKSLRPGRYLIEGWYEPGVSTPNGPAEPDGGLTLFRRLP